MVQVSVENLADHPGIHETIARWLWSEWGTPRNLGLFRSLVAHCRKDTFPEIFVAFSGGEPVGTVGLLRVDLVSRQDLYPWIGVLCVIPKYRGQGISTLLLDHAVSRAREMGFSEVFLYSRLRDFYERRGWRYLDSDEDDLGNPVSIYQKYL
jgi:predicted N-acetyltransferase YhbS